VRVKPWAGFIADFPDDQVEDRGEISLFGGRNVAAAIGEILTGLGCRVSAPEYAELHGWDFDAYYQDCRFYCQVTSFHPAFHLLFEDPASARGPRRKSAQAYAELAVKLAVALEGDPRFHHIEWRAFEDGPPEPDEIGSDVDRPADASSVIDAQGRDRTRGVGCLLFALFVILSGIVGLWVSWTGPGGIRNEDLFSGVFLICAGVLGLIVADVRRSSG
jgi:hypothetical protein